jgi:hypothetical protein
MTKKPSNPEPKAEWVDPDDAPELTEEWFRKAHLYHGETLIRRGEEPTREEIGERNRLRAKKD